MRQKPTIIIPSYNGTPLLKKHLPGVMKHSEKGTKIIVVDDGSVDGTPEWLAKEYPSILCLHNKTNVGFVKSVNLGVRSVDTDLFILLNNDVAVTQNYSDSAIKKFSDPKVFAVTFNETKSSWPQVNFDGKLNYTRAIDKTKAYYSAWASGGSAVFRTDYWRELGGLDEIFSPGYWEDIDIGWRAWKAGYSIIWDPKAKVVHEHESTFNLLNRQQLNLIKQRNELLFNWKNITDSGLRREHFNYLLHHSLSHPGYLTVIFTALKQFPKIKKTKNKLTDKEVLAIINQPVIDK